jgi:hypothetical protein
MSRKVAILLAFLLGGLALPALATDEPFNVEIRIRQPILITEVDFLDFGLIEAQATPQTYTISNAIASTTPQTSGVGSVIDGNSAEFTVAGDVSAPVTVSLNTTGPVVVAATVTYNLTLNPSGATALDGAGNLTVLVGGTADVIASPTSGNYTDTTSFILTFVYQ